jgi:predicted aspartyl protease
MSPSFTQTVSDITLIGPVVEISVAVPFQLEQRLQQSGQQVPAPVKIQAMIDTGASRTALCQDIVDQLGLELVGTTSVNTPSHQNVQCGIYSVRIGFPNNVVGQVAALGVPMKGQHIACLIGRDILKLGILIYNGHVNQFSLCLF